MKQLAMAAGAPFNGADADVAARLSQIMLRYRPIAPKPVAPGGSSSSSSGSPTAITTTTPRGRRRWCGRGDVAAGKDGRRGRRKRAPPVAVVAYSEEEVDGNVARLEPVTLPLLRESPESMEGPLVVIGPEMSMLPDWVGSRHQHQPTGSAAIVVVAVVVVEEEESTVSTGSSFESDRVGRWLCWCREEDARQGLEWDAWPAFVTDRGQTVRWTNPAFRRMVGWDGGAGGVRVEVGKKGERLASVFTMGFTCRVTVRSGASGKGTSLTTAPCDVWRLLDGCLAWRIDVGAALSLWH